MLPTVAAVDEVESGRECNFGDVVMVDEHVMESVTKNGNMGILYGVRSR
jgi:hypothetical protein